jgi:hypothetical protein
MTEHTYINAASACALLEKLHDRFRDLPIVLIMDNARDQRCKIVLEKALRRVSFVVGDARTIQSPNGTVGAGGVGHNPRGPHRQQPDIRGLSPDDAIRALWTFETHALYPDDHPQAGKPIPNVLGGWLAIQTALGVTPLQTDAAGRGALFESLGAGYAMSQDESSDALPLLGLHEIHFYGDSGRFVVPPT